MALSSVYKNFRDGKITLKDGTGSPLDLVIQYEPGDFSLTGLSQGNKEVTAYLDRGDFASLRHTNRTFPTGSFTAYCTEISDATNENVIDFIMKAGAFGSGVSTLGASAEVWTGLILLEIEGTDHGDSADHSISLDDCRLTFDFSEGDPDSFTVNFTCYGTISFT